MTTETTASTFDFDQALDDVQERFARNARALTAQEAVVGRLMLELEQAQRALDELQGEFDQIAQEEEDLSAYLGFTYDTYGSETRYWEPESFGY